MEPLGMAGTVSWFFRWAFFIGCDCLSFDIRFCQSAVSHHIWWLFSHHPWFWQGRNDHRYTLWSSLGKRSWDLRQGWVWSWWVIDLYTSSSRQSLVGQRGPPWAADVIVVIQNQVWRNEKQQPIFMLLLPMLKYLLLYVICHARSLIIVSKWPIMSKLAIEFLCH